MELQLRGQDRPKFYTIPPESRIVPADIPNPKFEDLVDLALLRVFDSASLLESRPPKLFPTAETVFAKYYAHDDWLIHGDLESEMGRMSYMLSNLPERGMPTECIAPVRSVLSSTSVLTAWRRAFPWLKRIIREEIRRVTSKMQKQQGSSTAPTQKSKFIAVPVDYGTSGAAASHSLRLWESALKEIVVEVSEGHFEQVRTFLQIFTFLKDPLGCLESVSIKAVDIFTYMVTALASSRRHMPGHVLKKMGWHAAAAQAAQEALFLSCPLLESVNYIHFTGHQQLPYGDVALDELPRSEFSVPGHVLRIIEEILTRGSSQNGGSCAIAPITVSSYPALPMEEGKHMTVIIDGNHRATATMVLRLIAERPTALTAQDHREVLDAFCADHGLGLKWKVDLAEVLETIRGSHCAALVRRKMDLVERFRDVQTIPALIVREDHFHTACQQRPALEDRPRLLLPIHQALYNDEKLSLAFPQAGQVHGRAVGFKAMPLVKPEG